MWNMTTTVLSNSPLNISILITYLLGVAVGEAVGGGVGRPAVIVGPGEYVCLRVDVSTFVWGDASDVMGYDRRTRELSNTPLQMKQNTTSIEIQTLTSYLTWCGRG